MKFSAWAIIKALVSGGAPVALKDHDGEITVRTARRDPFGELTTHRFSFDTTKCVLMDDGSVGGPSYVKQWAWLDPEWTA